MYGGKSKRKWQRASDGGSRGAGHIGAKAAGSLVLQYMNKGCVRGKRWGRLF